MNPSEQSHRFQAVVRSGWQSACDGNGSVIYVHSASCAPFLDEIACCIAPEHHPICWQLQEQDQLEPLSPFIPLLRQLINQSESSAEQLMEQLAIRGQFARMFCQLIADKRVKRDEAPTPDDLSYELAQMCHIIASIFSLLSARMPVMVAISGFEHAGESSWQLMLHLEEALANTQCLFVVGLNPDLRHGLETRQHSWDHLLTKTEDQTTVLTGAFSSNDDTRENTWPKLTRPLPKDDRALLAYCERLLFLLCLPEALTACNWVEKVFRQRRMGDSSGQMLHLLAIKGHALLYSRDFESAVGVFDRILEQAQMSGDHRSLLRAYRNLSWVHIYQSDYLCAIQYANQSIKFSQMLGDGKESVISLFALYVACDKSTSAFGLARFQKMVKELKNFQLYNSYIYAMRTLYVQRDFDEAITNRIALKACATAMKQARYFSNVAQVAAVFQNRAVIYGDMGRNSAALRCYLLSEKLRMQLDDAAELARIRNGIGFYYCLQENYQQAFDYYNKALTASTQIRDFTEVAVSLYNLATLYSFNHQYAETNILLDKLRELVRIRRTLKFPFRNLHDIHLLQGLSYAALKNGIRAEQCLERSNRLSHELSSLGEFFKPLLQAMLAMDNHAPKQAETLLIEAKAASDKAGAACVKFRLIALRGLAHAVALQGETKQSDEILDGAITLAEAYGYQHEIKKIQAQYHQGMVPIGSGTVLPIPELQLDHLIALARQEERISQLWMRLREVRLISALQKLLSRESEEERIATETLQMIGAHLNVQAGFVFSRSEQGLEQLAAFEQQAKPCLNATELAQRMNRNQEILLLQNHKWHFVQGECQTSSVLSVPLMDGNRQLGLMLLITFNPDIRINEHDKELVTVLANQMSNQLVRVQQQARLIELSTIDSLTGLYNRQATQARIREELLRLKRYGRPNEQLALAFIDLDNFKYYNDTWGHDVGDRVLQHFAHLLQQILRETDWAGRWGGDEFVALLPMVSLQQATKCGERILEAMKACSGFQAEIAQVLGQEVVVPVERQLSCSIGIAALCPQTHEEDLGEEQLIRHADEMVYQVKRHGKSGVRVYQHPLDV